VRTSNQVAERDQRRSILYRIVSQKIHINFGTKFSTATQGKANHAK